MSHLIFRDFVSKLRRRVRSVDRRRRSRMNILRVENLECRRLLAGDVVDFASDEHEPNPNPDNATVHGTKWEDIDGNGERGPNEPGLAGVTIYSDLNLNGRLERNEPRTVTMRDIPETDFDEAGLYWLAGLRPGEHYIREVVPSGFEQTFPPEIIVDPLPGAPGPFPQGRYHYAQLEPGDSVDGFDFGNHRQLAGSIHGLKWFDANGNAERESHERGVPGVTIYLDTNFNNQLDRGEPTTTTMRDNPQTDFDEAGHYWFDEVKPGSYNVREVVPDGAFQTFPQLILFDPLPPIGPFPNGASHFVIVRSGQSVTDIDFGNTRAVPGTAHGTKWQDTNGNGVRENNEPGLPGITIYSDLNFNNRLDRGEPQVRTMRDDPDTDFDEAGLYWLEDLHPGYHAIREVVPDGFVQTFPRSLVGPVDGVDFVNSGGQHVIFVAPGSGADGLDFGNMPVRQRASVHGTKWLDRNGNGRRDNNDVGVAGITIYSDLNFNGQLDRNEPHTQTMRDNPDTRFDETGMYWLEDLTPGRNHLITEILPDGFERTFPPPTGILAPWPISEPYYLFLASGTELTGIDFGNHPLDVEPGAVAGTKWIDIDGDRRRDDNEPGLAGVTIFADLNLNGEFDRGEPFDITHRDNPDTARDETGEYIFRLRPGSYLILEVEPDGYEQSFPNTNREIVFPRNLGHSVDVAAGRITDDVNFGNQPIPPTGTIHGVKWLDLNRNGVRERIEPGLAGVVIYLDINGNAQLDRNEPRVRSSKDNPNTVVDEAGRYEFAGLRAGRYTVREVVPEGFSQSFPKSVSIEGTSTENLPHGRAISYDLVATRITVDDAGFSNVNLTYEVVWPDSCSQLRDEEASFTVDGQMIDVHMFGETTGIVCLPVITTERQTINVGPLDPRGYGIEATLHETGNDFDAFQPSFRSTAKILVQNDGGHRVSIRQGETVRNVNFGNHRVGVLGDFDHDGVVDDMDLDILGRATRGGSQNIFYDLNHDGMINLRDRDVLVHRILGTTYGDTNLDTIFNSTDLILVFQANEYEDDILGNSTWAEGDWNGDGDFDSSDLVWAFKDGGYQQNASALAAAIDTLFADADEDEKRKQNLRSED